jgi:putative PEP-CTERM system TPR-repeat lipoprotein
MVKWLEQAMAAHPKELQPRVMLSRYYLSMAKPEQVPVLIGELDPSLKSQPDVLNVVGLSHLQRQEFLDAKVVFEQLASQRRDAPQPHHNLGLAFLGLGEKEDAKTEFEKALDISPSYIEPRLELVRLLLQQLDKDPAIENLAILKELSPEHPEVLQLDAVRARLDGNQKEALALTQSAFDKAPTTRNMLVLVQQNWGMGEKEKAEDILENWLQEHPKDVMARLELADMYLGQGEEVEAGNEYSKVLDLQKNNPLALNNLAWLLRDKNTKQALEYAERAVEHSKGSPLALDTLAVVLLKNNELSKAQRTIERAMKKNSTNTSIKYHSAMINAAVGDKAKAKQELIALLSEKDDFSERKEAEKLLGQL